MLTNAKHAATFRDSQRRFLDAYAVRPMIAPAARLAAVHRSTVYRWLLADPAFREALKAAIEEFFRTTRAKLDAENAARQKLLDERERARYPMRCRNLALARAAKRPKQSPPDASHLRELIRQITESLRLRDARPLDD